MREDSCMYRSYPITISNISAVLRVPGKEAGVRDIYNGNCIPHQLIYTLSGEKKVIFDYKEYHECADTLRFTPKNRVNANYEVLNLQMGECIDVCFDTLEPLELDCFVQSFKNNKKMRSLFLQIEKLWRTQKNSYYACMSLLYRILEELLPAQSSYLPKKKIEKIAPAIEYMNTHFSEHEFSYAKLPELSGMSEAYFRKLFRIYYGSSPQRYITNLRISYACDLLNSGLYTISAIAEMTGYENLFYFSKVFKQTVGVPPSQYLKYNQLERMLLQQNMDKL